MNILIDKWAAKCLCYMVRRNAPRLENRLKSLGNNPMVGATVAVAVQRVQSK